MAICVANHVDGYGSSLISSPCSPTARTRRRENLKRTTQKIPRARLKPNKVDSNSANHDNTTPCPTNQAVSPRLPIKEYRVQTHDNLCEIRSRQSATESVVSLSTTGSPCQYHAVITPRSSFTYHRRYIILAAYNLIK